MPERDRLLIHLNPSERLPRGACVSFRSITVSPETDDYATADCVVSGTCKSCWGTTYRQWLPLTVRSQDPLMQVAIFLGADQMDDPWTIETAKGQYLAITLGQDAESHKGLS